MTKIEWTERTWNPIVGCTKISPGCKNCYAERMAKRLKAMDLPQYQNVVGKNGWTGEISLAESVLNKPLKRKKPTTYFVNSMSDMFHENVTPDMLKRIWSVMEQTPQHTYQILTKRAVRINGILGQGLLPTLPNVWLGVSAENQETADARIPFLLDTPAAVRFVSFEPLLGAIDIGDWLVDSELRGGANEEFDRMAVDFSDDIDEIVASCEENNVFTTRRIAQLAWMQHSYDYAAGWLYLAGNPSAIVANRRFIDWVIVGGESGPGARPMNPNWVRSLRDQCVTASTPFFFKQWGEWLQNVRDYGCYSETADYNNYHVLLDNGLVMVRVGKKNAGKILDGKIWNETP